MSDQPAAAESAQVEEDACRHHDPPKALNPKPGSQSGAHKSVVVGKTMDPMIPSQPDEQATVMRSVNR